MLSVSAAFVSLYSSSAKWFNRRRGPASQVQTELLSDDDPTALYWWLQVGEPLAALLQAAHYTQSAQLEHLRTFVKMALPYFGSAQHCRHSFMTDTGWPVELSWDWGWDGCDPSVRFSIEPLFAPNAGNLLGDSREDAALHFTNQLSIAFGVPLHNFCHFWERLVVPSNNANAITKHTKTDARSQFFAGFDFTEDNFVLKAYFLPTLVAQSHCRSRYDVIVEAMQQAPGWSTFEQPFAVMNDFVQNTALRDVIDTEIFSLDVTAGLPARYKLYMRCQATSFASVQDMASLGGLISSSELDKSLAQLRKLWNALFQPAHPCDNWALIPLAHRTSGILYYFELCAGKPVSTPKIYLPVRHYAANDAHVERTVASFVSNQARSADGNASRACDFRAALRSIVDVRTMKHSRGLHTYIGCTLERGKVKVISYLNPSYLQ